MLIIPHSYAADWRAGAKRAITSLMNGERTIILYHGNCPDGFGGAYAAWKKLGDAAEYRPLSYGKPVPEDLAGAHLFFIDFCYAQDVMDRIKDEAASIVVLDHHLGTKETVESMPEHVFDNDHSGAIIAWTYFHPGAAVPLFLRYVEDGDLYRFALPNSRAVLAYLYAHAFDFATWDILCAEMEDEASRARLIEQGTAYAEYGQALKEQIAERASRVSFEGYECYFASATRAFTSDVGNMLARKKGPFALITDTRPDGVRVSLRGDGSVDVAAIARKYGGNGHPNSAAFFLPWGSAIPWTPIPDEDPRD